MMKQYLSRWSKAIAPLTYLTARRLIMPIKLYTAVLSVCSVVFLLAACGSGSGNTPTATPTPAKVNVFGTAANHTHSLLALPNGVLLLATHYGLFRSADAGKSWQTVAAGPHQLMEGLMTFEMSNSALNSQRVYVLTQKVFNVQKSTLGLYSSVDQGRTWKLAMATAKLGDMKFAVPGNDTPDEVFVYLDQLGTTGLKVSQDGGEHFSATGTLPFGGLSGMLAVPGAPGQLLAYGANGIARSSDSGMHWQVVSGINGAVFDIAAAGPGKAIYVSGDAGIYASQDGGKTFSLLYSQASYNSLAVSPAQPQELYGKLGTGVYRSTDGGHSWSALPALNESMQVLAVNPSDASQLYLATNYPTEVYLYNQSSAKWVSLTPNS